MRKLTGFYASLAVAALLAGAAAPATAQTSAAPPGPAWQRYVEGPRNPDVTPARVVSTSGSVTNPGALVHPGSGTTTLTMAAGGAAPTVLLDYGEDTGGLPYFAVTGSAGAPVMHVSYSEAEQYANQQDGDTNPTTFFPRPGEDPHRYDDYPVTGPGTIRAQLVQGAQRFERITLTAPGSVTLSAVGIAFGAYDATPAKWLFAFRGVGAF